MTPMRALYPSYFLFLSLSLLCARTHFPFLCEFVRLRPPELRHVEIK